MGTIHDPAQAGCPSAYPADQTYVAVAVGSQVDRNQEEECMRRLDSCLGAELEAEVRVVRMWAVKQRIQ